MSVFKAVVSFCNPGNTIWNTRSYFFIGIVIIIENIFKVSEHLNCQKFSLSSYRVWLTHSFIFCKLILIQNDLEAEKRFTHSWVFLRSCTVTGIQVFLCTQFSNVGAVVQCRKVRTFLYRKFHNLTLWAMLSDSNATHNSFARILSWKSLYFILMKDWKYQRWNSFESIRNFHL